MFIELHNGNGDAFLFNTESMATIISGSNIKGCNTSIRLAHSEDGLVNVKESYDEVKALLAGQVVAAPQEPVDLPEGVWEEYGKLLTKLYLGT